ncbi:MAG: hypothetical protein ABIX28_11650 [Vicinamibacterales bacterium]
MTTHDAHSGDERAGRAAAIFRHHTDTRVVEGQIDRHHQPAEEGVAAEPDGEGVPLDREIRGQARVDRIEEPRVDDLEQHEVGGEGEQAEPQEPPDVAAAGGAEPLGTRGSRASVAVDTCTETARAGVSTSNAWHRASPSQRQRTSSPLSKRTRTSTGKMPSS